MNETKGRDREIQMSKDGEPQIAVDGYQQVLEMLKIADSAFRESLLHRLAQRDPALVKQLRRELAQY
jgi:hypothetical protein